MQELCRSYEMQDSHSGSSTPDPTKNTAFHKSFRESQDFLIAFEQNVGAQFTDFLVSKIRPLLDRIAIEPDPRRWILLLLGSSSDAFKLSNPYPAD